MQPPCGIRQQRKWRNCTFAREGLSGNSTPAHVESDQDSPQLPHREMRQSPTFRLFQKVGLVCSSWEIPAVLHLNTAENWPQFDLNLSPRRSSQISNWHIQCSSVGNCIALVGCKSAHLRPAARANPDLFHPPGALPCSSSINPISATFLQGIRHVTRG